jgi:hypothetical protein
MLAQNQEAPMEITLNMNALDSVTRDWIQDEARRTGASVEEVIERLIKRGITAERQAARAQRYHDLDNLAGIWNAEEADAFRAATTDFAQIDTTLWQ